MIVMVMADNLTMIVMVMADHLTMIVMVMVGKKFFVKISASKYQGYISFVT